VTCSGRALARSAIAPRCICVTSPALAKLRFMSTIFGLILLSSPSRLQAPLRLQASFPAQPELPSDEALPSPLRLADSVERISQRSVGVSTPTKGAMRRSALARSDSSIKTATRAALPSPTRLDQVSKYPRVPSSPFSRRAFHRRKLARDTSSRAQRHCFVNCVHKEVILCMKR
jgi:hypothetical protein